MAKLSILAGSTSQSVNVFVRDSTSTTGGGLAAVAPAGGSLLTGTKLYYSFTGTHAAAGTAITLNVLAAVNTAWNSAGAIVTIDGTNMIGWVRIDIPNAALAGTNGRVVSFLLFGGTNMAPTPFEIELTGFDNQSVTDGGLSKLTSLTFTGAGKVDASARDWGGTTITATSIPVATAAGAAGGLFIAGTNAATTITTSLTTHIVGTVDTVTTYTGNTPQTGDSYARIGAAGAGLTAVTGVTLAANQHVIVDSGTITTYTGNTPQTGDSYARIGAAGAGLTAITGVTLAASQPGVTIPTVTTVGTTTNSTNAPTAGDLTATMKMSVQTAADAAVTANATIILINGHADANTSSRMATYSQPTGFLAATFPATVASPTNITAATGVVLASTGLDSIATTAPAGVASNFREMLVQTWRRFFKKATMTATQTKTYADDGTTVLTTQATSDDNTTQVQNSAS